MNEILKKQIWRKLEGLPDEKGYQLLDYIEYLQSQYASEHPEESRGFQRFSELLQGQMRLRKVPATAMRETMRVLGATDKVLGAFREAGREFLAEMEQGRAEPAPRRQDEPPASREIEIRSDAGAGEPATVPGTGRTPADDGQERDASH